MQIVNAKGEKSLTPVSQSREDAKKAIQGKKFATMTRAEKDELLVLLCELNGIEVK